jgi:ketosteroid isomerase-like protein
MTVCCATPGPTGDARARRACAPPSPGSAFPPFTDFIGAFNARDGASFAEAFADDATTFFDLDDPAGRVEGRSRILDVFRPRFSGTGAAQAIQLRPTAVRWQEIAGTVLVTFQLESSLGVGRRSILFRCDPDATWRIVHLHASSVEHTPTGR